MRATRSSNRARVRRAQVFEMSSRNARLEIEALVVCACLVACPRSKRRSFCLWFKVVSYITARRQCSRTLQTEKTETIIKGKTKKFKLQWWQRYLFLGCFWPDYEVDLLLQLATDACWCGACAFISKSVRACRVLSTVWLLPYQYLEKGYLRNVLFCKGEFVAVALQQRVKAKPTGK